MNVRLIPSDTGICAVFSLLLSITSCVYRQFDLGLMAGLISVGFWIEALRWFTISPAFLWVRLRFDPELYPRNVREQQFLKPWATTQIKTFSEEFTKYCLEQEKCQAHKKRIEAEIREFLGTASSAELSYLKTFREREKGFQIGIAQLETAIRFWQAKIKEAEKKYYLLWGLFEALQMLPDVEPEEKLPLPKVYLKKVREELTKQTAS